MASSTFAPLKVFIPKRSQLLFPKRSAPDITIAFASSAIIAPSKPQTREPYLSSPAEISVKRSLVKNKAPNGKLTPKAQIPLFIPLSKLSKNPTTSIRITPANKPTIPIIVPILSAGSLLHEISKKLVAKSVFTLVFIIGFSSTMPLPIIFASTLLAIFSTVYFSLERVINSKLSIILTSIFRLPSWDINSAKAATGVISTPLSIHRLSSTIQAIVCAKTATQNTVTEKSNEKPFFKLSPRTITLKSAIKTATNSTKDTTKYTVWSVKNVGKNCESLNAAISSMGIPKTAVAISLRCANAFFELSVFRKAVFCSSFSYSSSMAVSPPNSLSVSSGPKSLNLPTFSCRLCSSICSATSSSIFWTVSIVSSKPSKLIWIPTSSSGYSTS